jgi:hypothetical protein
MAALCRTTKAPPRPWSRPAGSRSAHALGIDDSSAPIAAECQSFLDSVIAQFWSVWAWNDRRGPNDGQSDHVFGATAHDGWVPLYSEKDSFHETLVTLGSWRRSPRTAQAQAGLYSMADVLGLSDI